MKKANNTPTTTLPTADVMGIAYQELTEALMPNEYRRAVSSLEDMRQRYASERKAIRQAIVRANDYKVCGKQLAEQVASTDTTEAQAKAKKTIATLSRFPWIASIDAREDSLLIRTRVFFQDIRVSRADETTRRVAIGAYTIEVSPTERYWRVYNDLFPHANLPHWSVNSSHTPCEGDWNDELTNAFTSGDLVRLLTIIRSYLLSTDDGSAYTSSHHWVDERIGFLQKKVFRRGGYAMLLTASVVDGSELPAGTRVKIAETDNSHVLVEWDIPTNHPLRNAQHAHADTTNYTLSWWVERNNVTPLTKAQYTNPSLTVDVVSPDRKLAEVDALPDGATLAEAQALLANS